MHAPFRGRWFGKWLLLGLGLGLMFGFSAERVAAQTQPAPPANKAAGANQDPFQALQGWMEDNLDERVVRAIQDVDPERVKQFLTALQQRFADTNVYELGSFKETAERALPVLLQFEETRPYGAWLQNHLDYLEVSREMQRIMTPPPVAPVKPVQPGQPAPPPPPPPPPPQPTPMVQRNAWIKVLSQRPLPANAQRYVPRMKEIFVAEKLPAELVWVAEVESAFNPEARSPVGAAGLFQLMPATARSLSLSTFPSDERLQPEKNARAAARYLRQLHGHYHDWPLALAAYNAGEGRVDNLLRQQKAHSFDAIAHRLPAETQMYVPKIDATMRKREGHGLAELELAKGG